MANEDSDEEMYDYTPTKKSKASARVIEELQYPWHGKNNEKYINLNDEINYKD
jgi:hypothetical protein